MPKKRKGGKEANKTQNPSQTAWRLVEDTPPLALNQLGEKKGKANPKGKKERQQREKNVAAKSQKLTAFC